MQLPADFQTVETRCGRESHTRPRGPSESPDGVDPNIRRTRKTQRDSHNSGVKIWSLCSVSSILSHANLTNKLRGKILLKKSSCVFTLASSLMRRLSLCQYLPSIYMCISAWISRWQCNSMNYCYLMRINENIQLYAIYIYIYTNLISSSIHGYQKKRKKTARNKR